MKRLKEVSEFIENANDEQPKILALLRDLIEKNVPDAEEQFKWSRPVYATGKDFCYLASTKKHATLGFTNFQKISDPNQLLEGTGKNMRHIKITKLEDCEVEVLAKMIRESSIF